MDAKLLVLGIIGVTIPLYILAILAAYWRGLCKGYMAGDADRAAAERRNQQGSRAAALGAIEVTYHALMDKGSTSEDVWAAIDAESDEE